MGSECLGRTAAPEAAVNEVGGDRRDSLDSTQDGHVATRFIAIDWSGAKSGERRKIWYAAVQDGHRSITPADSPRLNCNADRL